MRLSRFHEEFLGSRGLIVLVGFLRFTESEVSCREMRARVIVAPIDRRDQRLQHGVSSIAGELRSERTRQTKMARGFVALSLLMSLSPAGEDLRLAPAPGIQSMAPHKVDRARFIIDETPVVALQYILEERLRRKTAQVFARLG